MQPLTGMPAVDDLISRLALEPHPEGGYYRETFRGGVAVEPVDGRGTRDGGTAILFLLPAGARSRLHRVISDEVWAFQGGDPVRLRWWSARGESVGEVVLGHGDGQVPQATVPAGCWQDAAPALAKPDAGWSLCGCVVVPGFDFADFVLIDAVLDPLLRAHLARAVAWLDGDAEAAEAATNGLQHIDPLAIMVLESEGIIELVDVDGEDPAEDDDEGRVFRSGAGPGDAAPDEPGYDDDDLGDLDERIILLAQLLAMAEEVAFSGSAQLPADAVEEFRAALAASPVGEEAAREVLEALG